MARIGFMQGRLCARVDGKIQAFPWRDWESEFPAAQALGLPLMEWTIDQERLYENPLLTPAGRARINELGARHGLTVASLTGDCFMQAPFWKTAGEARERLLVDLRALVDACAAIGARYVVVPLVDNGSIENDAQRASLLDGLLPLAPTLAERRQAIVFESDFAPDRLARFMEAFPAATFGINYDIGNSASLGFDPREEIRAFGGRILNVHVKDRVRGGTTVPLGTGAADFPTVFAELARANYRGDFIMQTARAADDDHAGVLARYRDLVRGWIAASGL